MVRARTGGDLGYKLRIERFLRAVTSAIVESLFTATGAVLRQAGYLVGGLPDTAIVQCNITEEMLRNPFQVMGA